MSKKISVGGIYELVDGRICTIKYIGETHFAGGEWIGVELDPSSGPGKNDGEIGSKRYFKTPKNPPRGLFVRRSKIVGEVSGKRRKAGPRQTGTIKSPDWKPAKFEKTSAEKGAFLQKYVPNSGANVEIRDSHDSSVVIVDGRRKKIGPRDIDYSHKGWKPAKYETSDTGAFLQKRGVGNSGTEVRQQSDTQHRIVDGKLKKLGPREIGRMKTPHWKPATYVDLKEERAKGGFLDKRLSDKAGKTYTETRDQHDASITVVDGKIKKLGPREIGRMKTPHWKPAKYETSDTGGFLEKRFSGNKHNVEVRQTSDTQHAVVDGRKKKLGPREIGRMKNPDWKPANYVDLKAQDGKGFLAPKFSGKTANIADTRDSHDASIEIVDGKIKKLGPRQIGRMKETPDWKPAKYDVDTGGGGFLDKKFSKNSHFSEVEKRDQTDTNFVMKGDKLRKAGPRDIGKIDNPHWKPAKFETNDGVVSNPVQSGGLEPGFEIRDGKRKALGPRDIGKTEQGNWKPANYDRNPVPNDTDDPVEEDDEQHYDTHDVDEHQEEMVYEEDHVYAEGDVVVEAGSAPEDGQGDEYVHEDNDELHEDNHEVDAGDKDSDHSHGDDSGDKALENVDDKALESGNVEEVVAEQAEPL